MLGGVAVHTDEKRGGEKIGNEVTIQEGGVWRRLGRE